MAISTGAAILGAAGVSAVSSIIGGNKAAKSQRKAADASIELQREMFDRTRADLEPFIGTGTNALAALEFDLGLRQDRVNLTPDIKEPELKRVNPTFGFGSREFDSRAEAENALAKRNANLTITRTGPTFTAGDRTFDTRREAKAYLDDFLANGGSGASVVKTPGQVMVGGRAFANRAEAQAFIDSKLGQEVTKTPGGWSVGGREFANRADAQAHADKKFAQRGGEYYQGYQRSPGYQERLQAGVDALDASATAAGSLLSGAALKRVNRFGQDFAVNDYANHLQRLSGVMSAGQNAAAGAGSIGANFAAQGTNALMAAGNASANNAINTTNAINGFLSNGIGALGFGGGGGGGGGFAPPPFAVNRTGTGMLPGFPR